MNWSAEQYLRFGGQRLRPVIDLINAIDLSAPGRVVDLGCGPGNATAMLRERWPDCMLTGVDNDPAMLAKARTDYPGEQWIERDIAAWVDGSSGNEFDLVFTNAALHWLSDHAALFPKILGKLAHGGKFACQMPRNFAAPSHRLLRATMKESPWRDRLAEHADWEPVAEPSAYYDWLRPHSSTLDIWETEYLHVLSGEDAVLEWVKGTALVPVREALDAGDYADFIARYGLKLREAYPRRTDGATLLPFRRLFMVAGAK